MNIKKLFAILAGVSMVANVALPGLAQAATPDNEMGQAYEWAYSKSITTMDSFEKANMYGKITRAELAKMLANWAKTSDKVSVTIDETKSCEFTDTASVKGDLGVAIKESCQMGLMGQGITAFRPYDTITRGEFGTALSRALWGNKYDGATPFYVNHLNALKAAGIMTQISNPDMQEVRGYVMIMLMRVEGTDIADIDNPTDGKEESTVAPGYVTVTGKAAADQEVAKNAVNKKVGTITLTAGDNDTKVSSVVVKHSGLGDAENVSVQLFNDGVAATSQKRISKSSQEVTLKLSPAVVVKAKSSVTFDVVASLEGKSNETHNFSVTAVNVANGKAEWAPVELGTLKTTSYEVSDVNVKLTDDGATLKAWDTDKAFVSVRMQPVKKWTINGVTITKQDGNKDLNELVSNVKAYYNDEVVGTVTVTDEKIIVSNLKIERNASQSVTIELRGDCIYVWNEEPTKLAVELNDVLAVEANTNENMRANFVGGGEDVSNEVTFTVNWADLTLKKMSKGEQTVVPGAPEVELLNIQVSAKSELEINDYTVEFTNDIDLADYFVEGLVTVYVDGEDYEMTEKSYSFGKKESFTVDADSPVTIRVVGNLLEADEIAGNEDIAMKLTLKKAKVSDNNNQIELTDYKKWDTTKIKAASVVVKSSTAPASDSLFGKKEQEIWRFSLKASSDDVTIKSLAVSLSGDAAEDEEVIGELLNGNIRLVDADNKDEEISATVEDIAEGVIKFKSMNLSIKKDKTVNVKVLADLGDIDDVLWKSLQLVLSGWEYKTTSTSITDFDGWNYEMKAYTFKATAPIVEFKTTNEDNMIEVTIRNEASYDEGVTLVSLGYTVKSLSKDEFIAAVCVVGDANTTNCEDEEQTWSLGKTTVVHKFDDVNLSEDSEVTYYIVVDGDNITPEVLEASIVNLKYKVWDDVFTEKYSLKSNFR